MNKRLIIFGVLLAALLLSAVSPWPATLRVWNFTGDNIYFTLKYRGVQKYFLTATPEGNSPLYYLSVFDLERRAYTAQVTACGTTTSWAKMNMVTNLRLTFTGCESMKQFWTPKYWGEPTMEKPNFWSFSYLTKTGKGNTYQHVPENDPFYGYLYGAHRFRFLYDVVASTCFNDSKPWPSIPDTCQ